jgi:hypothetical protein
MKSTKLRSLTIGFATLLFALTSTAQTAFPVSEQNYSGASSSKPFIAIPGDQLFINGGFPPLNVLGKIRSYDFGGDIPFLNVYTGAPDPYILQGWNKETGSVANLDYNTIKKEGLVGHIEKQGDRLMVQTEQGDGMLGSSGKTFLISYPVPPRTHIRWEMDVAFGDANKEWELLIPGTQPVNFWELKSPALIKAAFSVNVDTDVSDPQKLSLTFLRAIPVFVNGVDKSTVAEILVVHNIDRHASVPIIIEAFLDERTTAEGKGRLRFTVNGVQYNDSFLPTLVPYKEGIGDQNNVHTIQIGAYTYNEKSAPVSHTRATFWKTARLFVYPLGR